MKWPKFIQTIFSEKCEFADRCEWYRKDAVTCNEDGGIYGHDHAGCWYSNHEKWKKKK